MEEKKTLTKQPKEEGKKVKNVSAKGLDFIIVGAIAGVFLLCPLFFTGMVAQGIGFEKMALFYFLVLVGTVAWVTKGVISGELELKRTPLDIPNIIILAIFTVSTIISVSTKDSLVGSYGSSAKGLVALIVFMLFYYLVVNNLNVKRIKIVFWSIVTSSSLIVVYSLLQLKGIHILPFGFSKNVGFNPLGSLSGLTMYLVIALPLLLVAVAQLRNISPKLNKIFAYALKSVLGIILVGLFVVLAFLNGFTFWPVAIISMVIVLMFFLSKIIRISNNNLLIPLAGFLALIILLVLGNFDIPNLRLPAEVSLSRSASWDIAKSAVRENPVFGSGPSTFYYSFSKFKDASFNASPLWNVRFDSASGALFELLATIGIVGTLALIVLALISLSLSFLTLIKTKDKEINSILLGLFAALISAILLALLFSQNNSLILVTVIISIFAVSASLVMYPEKFSNLKLSFRSTPKYALALAAIFLCVSAGVVVLFTMGLKMYLGDVHAREALQSSDIGEKIEYLNKAISFAPYQDIYYLNIANNYMALANQAAMSGKDQTIVGTNLSKAIESGKKAVEIAENKAGNNESLALIYENASFYTRGALEWAENLYSTVIALDPTNPTPYLRIALINMARANAEADSEEQKFYIGEAIKMYDKAIEKKGDLASAYYGKAIASEKLADIDDAIEQLKRANLISRNNLDYRFELGRLYFNRGVAQLALSQEDSQRITETEIYPDGSGTSTSISVKPRDTGPKVGRNSDLTTAEQTFLSIMAANPNHANASYSLAVLYQKIGEEDNARVMVKTLLNIIDDKATKQAILDQFGSILQE